MQVAISAGSHVSMLSVVVLWRIATVSESALAAAAAVVLVLLLLLIPSMTTSQQQPDPTLSANYRCTHSCPRCQCPQLLLLLLLLLLQPPQTATTSRPKSQSCLRPCARAARP